MTEFELFKSEFIKFWGVRIVSADWWACYLLGHTGSICDSYSLHRKRCSRSQVLLVSLHVHHLRTFHVQYEIQGILDDFTTLAIFDTLTLFMNAPVGTYAMLWNQWGCRWERMWLEISSAAGQLLSTYSLSMHAHICLGETLVLHTTSSRWRRAQKGGIAGMPFREWSICTVYLFIYAGFNL